MGTIRIDYKVVSAFGVFNVPATYGTNLLTGDDTNFEAGIGGWNSSVSTLTSSTTVAHGGTHSLRASFTGAGGGDVRTAGIVVTAGTNYGAYLFVRTGVTTRIITPKISWYSDSAATTLISTTSGGATGDISTAWSQFYVAGLAPASAIRARLVLTYGNSAASELHYIDDVFFGTTTGGITAIDVSTWAGGGSGGTANINGGGGGGAGGFSQTTGLTVIAGQSYQVAVGSGGTPGSGGDSAFGGTLVVAKGGGVGGNGSAGGHGTAGTGGQASAGTGTTKTNGGDGGGPNGGTQLQGGAGGGSGGSGSNGGNGQSAPNALGGTAGTGTYPGAAGGNGGQSTTPAVAGTAPGGAGGGASTLAARANGAEGRVVVEYTYVDDSVTASDQDTRTVVFNRAIADSVTLTDQDTRATGFNRANADSVSVSDANVKTAVLPRADSLTVSESSLTTVTANRADSVTATDQATKTVSFIRANSETVTATDAISKQISLTFADTIGAAGGVTVHPIYIAED